MDYTGTVSGIDVIATKGKPVRCLAFISKKGGSDYVQVVTKLHQLQTALELASSKAVEVEVAFDEKGGQRILRRVRLLDR